MFLLSEKWITEVAVLFFGVRMFIEVIVLDFGVGRGF